ncbi:hypothetical protein DFR65_1067 [Oceanihabitans sediminis]|nr:hypothetical protein DFR65_1067 [Oceanihabitans sediminis]
MICTNCKSKAAFTEIFHIKPNESYFCKNCQNNLEPVFHSLVLKTWKITPFLGFLTTAAPIFIINYIIEDRWKAYGIGGTIGVLCFVAYLYFVRKTTKFQ